MFAVLLLLIVSVAHGTARGRFGERAFETWRETPCAIVSAGAFELRATNHACVVVECSARPESACDKRSELARDGQAFVAFIVAHYDTLPSYTFFVHGHATAWHQHARIDFASTHAYRGLNAHPIEAANLSRTPYGDIWRAVFPRVPTPGRICCDGSLQFVAHRDRIRARPLDDWRELEHYVFGTKTWPGADAWSDGGVSLAPGDFKGSSYFVEWVMHILLGEPACNTVF